VRDAHAPVTVPARRVKRAPENEGQQDRGRGDRLVAWAVCANLSLIQASIRGSDASGRASLSIGSHGPSENGEFLRKPPADTVCESLL
jgi:hypothetical protein